MKKLFLLLLLFVLSSVSVSAQWKVGKMKQDFKYGNEEDGAYFEKGEICAYTENSNGTITLYQGIAESQILKAGSFSTSKVKPYIEFTGYYYGKVTDPVDNYVNVRKGPGTNYPVVGKLKVDSGCFWLFQKTETNWLKVYGDDKSKYGGFFTTFAGWTCEPEGAVFLGYVYKDRMTNPIQDWTYGVDY